MAIKQKTNGNTIKFDMSADETSREEARRTYGISKMMKEAGLRIGQIRNACSDPISRKLFNLGAKGKSLSLSISVKGKTDLEKLEAVGEIQEQFAMMPDFVIIKDVEFKSEKSGNTHYFLFKSASPTT
jgi:hypothetical protein